MKKLLLCLVLVCGSISLLQAQKVLQEAVYLKNGSIVRGVIIEQVPNQSLKLQTADGSIFVYQMSEVSKITKEDFKSQYGQKNTMSRKGEFNSGYKGFVDFGYTVKTGDWDGAHISVMTSHGYKFNPHFFLGAGVGYHYYTAGDGASVVPIFAHARASLLDADITPFFDLKIGYSVADGDGFFLNPSIGTSFALSPRNAVNASIGYTLQRSEGYYYDYYSGYAESFSANIGGISFKVGFEF